MRVLIIGGGGREHALAWKLAQSRELSALYVAPGNDGMGELATRLDAHDLDSWVAAAERHQIDLTVVGPEVPLVNGLADRLRARGRAVFGPGAAAARLEGDKAFAKEFLRSAGIRTADAEAFTDSARALRYLERLAGPCVVKATGLAAGKGVTVCDDVIQAQAAVRAALDEHSFGAAGATVLIEERLSGPELSVFAVLDGERICWLPASRDHKRLLDGDAGPNTGGMGAYTPVADARPQLMDRIDTEILQPTMRELQRRGLEYRGLLYVGLMLTAAGPAVLEYNCRFGDPETQAVMAAIDSDLLALMEGAAQGRMAVRGSIQPQRAAVCIVLAAEGYPVAPVRHRSITGLAAAADQALIFHAGTRRVGHGFETDGGRVLNVVGTGAQLADARSRALTAAARVRFEGMQYRRDIAWHEEGGA